MTTSNGTGNSMEKKIVVVSGILPDEILPQQSELTNGNDSAVASAKEESDASALLISQHEADLDALDLFNHPRIRRVHILKALATKASQYAADETTGVSMIFEKPTTVSPTAIDLVEQYKVTQSHGLLTFLTTAWSKWCSLGSAGQDPMASLKPSSTAATTADGATTTSTVTTPALIPGSVPLPRDPHQRPSKNVMGQIAYYCTDNVTPVFDNLVAELQADAAIVQHSLDLLTKDPMLTVYAIPTHPGHHAAQDSFGGYCYLNQAAFAAHSLLQSDGISKVAVLDIDYHCGNGTASIFYDNPNVLVVSIHCHPDYDYPFHSGFEDENETAQATYHVPLLPGATWTDHYQPALERAMIHISQTFGAQALIVSMGLDTLGNDPVVLRRAGFRLSTECGDYCEMGQLIGRYTPADMPCLFIQEGGYKMDELGLAAADIVAGFVTERTKDSGHVDKKHRTE